MILDDIYKFNLSTLSLSTTNIMETPRILITGATGYV